MLLAAFVLLVGAIPDAMATDWAKAMFDHTSHDFGMVPRGAEAVHRFSFENIYLEDVHVKSLSSSCQCTLVKVTSPSLKTHEKSEVVATLNTRQFTGPKDATIRVVFDKPFPAEVQLHIHSYIRTDVVLEPGSVQFGQVTEGATVTKTLTLRHAGSETWKITGHENQDPNIDLSIQPVSANSGQLTYQLTFTLKPTAPAGYIRRHVALLTNDQNPNARRVLVPIEGVVAPSVSVRPSPVAFGQVPLGREVTRNLVVHGETNFQVLEVAGPDKRFHLSPSAKLNTPSRVHLLPVAFTAGTEPGKLTGEILIRTDIDGGRILKVDVSGEVIDESKSATPTSAPADGAPADGAPAGSAPAGSAPAGSAPADGESSADGWRSAKK